MPTPLRQTSFAGGELAPTLYGRADLAKYMVGAKSLRNFFVERRGAALTRPGTVYVGEVKSSTAGPVRLIPFVYSDTQAYVLELGNLYLRVWSAGSMVAEVVTPYVTADLPHVKFAQQGSIVTLCHHNKPPAELSFNGTTWAYAAIVFARPAPTCVPVLLQPLFAPDSTHVAREWQYQVTEVRVDARGNLYESAPFKVINMALDNGLPWSATQEYPVGAKAVASGGTQYRAILGGNVGKAQTNATYWVVDNTSTTPPGTWTSAVATSFPVYSDMPATLRIGATYGLVAVDPSFITYRVYKGAGGFFGHVGDTKQPTFTDNGIVPDYTSAPPQGTSPFQFYDTSGNPLPAEYPGVVTFFEERRVFARTNNRPGLVAGSATGDYANFDHRLVPINDELVTFELASHKLEETRFLVGLSKMLTGTNSSIWAVGGDGGQLAFDNIDAKRQSEVGSSWVDPIVLDGALLYARTKGAGARAIDFDFAQQSFKSVDISILANHLFLGRQIVAWCHAEDPWSLIWVVLDNGALVSLTYVKEQDVWAWTHHDTPGGFYESCCAIPEGNEDAVYFVVRRTINGVTKRYIERMASRVILDTTRLQVPGNFLTSPFTAQGLALDCSTVLFGVLPSGGGTFGTFTFSTLGYLEGQQVVVILDGGVLGPFTVTGGSISFPAPAATTNSSVYIGLQYTPEFESLDPAIQGAESKGRVKQVSKVFVEVDESRGLKIGPDFSNLREWEQRQVSDGFNTVGINSGGIIDFIDGSWGFSGRVAVRQTQPLPLTLLSITRTLEFGDD